MQLLDDIDLLREYASRNSETAFATLVNRRIGFVYSAALRQVRDPHLAEEVTQSVFILLAQKATQIPGQTVLSGWLFNTTRFIALAQLRAAAKRHQHEQEVQMESEIEAAAPEQLWQQMSPLLDEALSALGEKDRQAVLLRFFENKSLAEVGDSLGAGEDAARKRVSRALEKLHGYFIRRGVSSTTALIAAAMATHSVHAAPAALPKSITVMAVAKGAVAGSSTLTLLKGTLKLMAWSKAQTAAVGLVVVGVTAVSVIQHQSQNKLRGENQSLRQQMESLQADNEQLSNRVSQISSSPAPEANTPNELLRLRGEVGVLRRQTNELGHLLANQARRSSPTPQQTPAELPEDYPKTAEGATKSIFEALGRGDLDAFFTNFGEPGVPKEMYDKIFNDDRIKT
jgi:RNA polymerase sigma factor (sigma-70 family)